MKGMIVAPQPIAVEEGAKVLMAGGNAFDAAITCAFVQGVVSPQMCGIGGYMLLTAHPAAGAPGDAPWRALDAPAVAGSLATPDMWQDLVLRPNPDGWGFFLQDKLNDVGYRSVCVPGAVKGLARMLAEWGTLSWEQAIAPAARIAENGFMVDATLAAGWRETASHPEASALIDYVRANAEARRIYLKEDRNPYAQGDTLRNPDLARTLEHLAQHGADDFYHGALARRMAEDLAANGSYVTAQDLEEYTEYVIPQIAPPAATFGDCTIVSSPAPHGGPTLLAILKIMEGYDLTALGHNSPQYIYLVSMAMKAAFADRNPYLGDPRFVEVPVDWMISEQRAAGWRAHIDAGRPITVSFAPPEPRDTTHVSVVDAQGNAVALTHSLGSSSGAITPGLGFMYNNSMVNFHPYPGHPNSIAPRKGRTTGMTPTIVYRAGRPILVIGAPGATRIVTSLAQVILNVLVWGMSVSDAVLAPRFDCQGERIRCQARIPEYICAEVRKRHPIRRMAVSHGGLALVHAIGIDPVSGALSGGADTGSGGMALLV
jgi:gamma-glutamyltranspeptidase/glutathione hydrolase